MNALPSDIDDNLLYFFTFGPRTGETILLRIPPNHWLIVDSFNCDGRPAADVVVGKYGGRVACIVLTHPHQDHHLGIRELLELNSTAVIGCMHPKANPPQSPLSPDPVVALKQRAKTVYDRIMQEWTNNPTRKWVTFRKEFRKIGDATITSLHPPVPVDPTQFGNRPNEISSAMLVEWHGLRLLLGADVPRTQWSGIAKDFKNLGDHAAMKIPHHGSTEAIHQSYAKDVNTRCWVVTAFSPQALPSAADDHGLERMLKHVKELHLTSLPFNHANEAESPCVTTRKQIRDNRRPQRRARKPAAVTLADLNRHVIVSFDRTGQIQEILHGPGSVVVSE